MNNKLTLYSLLAPISRQLHLKKFSQNFCAITCNISLLLNSFLPYFAAVPAYAQEADPTPIVESTPAPTPQATITETPVEPTEIPVEPTAIPTAEPVVTPEATLEPTAIPTEEPTLTPEPTIDPTITPVVTEEPIITPETTPTENNNQSNSPSNPVPDTSSVIPTPAFMEPLPTPTPTPSSVEQICLTSDIPIRDSVELDWNYDATNDIYVTREKVQLGIKYIFPKENNVTVTFTSLPKDELYRSYLKIKQVKTSDLKLPQDMGTVGEYAYDITTDMFDGQFKYDITLPKNSDQNAEISYINKSLEQAKLNVSLSEINTIDESKVEQQDSSVKATSVDHFTIFIVYMFDSNGQIVVNPSEPDNNHKIEICHSTGSPTNPYTNPTVDDSSILGTSPGNHGNDSNDIIPKFDYKLWEVTGTQLVCPNNYFEYGSATQCRRWSGNHWNYVNKILQDVYGWVTHSYPGKNWTPENQAILNNGCNIPSAPTLKLVKVIDHGQAQPGNWTLTASGTTNGFSDAGNSITFHTVSANTAYTLTESTTSPLAEGYSQFGPWSCNGGSLVGNTITLSLGQNVTCTVTNHRDVGSIKVNKKIDLNGDGDWNDSNESSNTYANSNGLTWLLDGVGWSFGTTVPNLDTTISNYWHTLEENMPSGYVFVSWYQNDSRGKTCTNPDGTSLPLGRELSITKNQTTEITLCNKKEVGSLKIIKDSQPDDTQNFIFTLKNSANQTVGSTELDDDNVPNSRPNNHIFTNLIPGSYRVDENLVSGWTLENVTCTNTTGEWRFKDGNLKVEIKAGEQPVCTFTNTKLGSITLSKDTNPDQNSDHRTYFDYSGTLGNGTLYDGDTDTFNDLLPGSYTITEAQTFGWYLNDIVCSGSASVSKDIPNRSVTISIKPGESSSCEFKNYKNGRIYGEKYNDKNGNNHDDDGEEDLSNWTIFIDKDNDAELDSNEISTTTNSGGDYSFNNLISGTYRVCEVPQPGWYSSLPNQANCQSTTINNDGGDEDELSFGNHQSVTINAYKIVCDSESQLPNWGNGAPDITSTTAQNFVNTHPGCHLETGWNFQYGFGSKPGHSGVLTYGNGDQLGLAPVGTGYNNWKMLGSTDGTNPAQLMLNNLEGATRVWIRESLQADYVPFSFPPGPNPGNSYSAELYCSRDGLNYDNYDFINNPKFGDTYHCVAFNALKTGEIVVHKYNDLNGNGQRDCIENSDNGTDLLLTREVCQLEPLLPGWTMNLTDNGPKVTNANGSATFDQLTPGTYTLSEDIQSGWNQTAITCSNDAPPTFCGNGIIEGNEQCDDYNNQNGDGCSSTCREEISFNFVKPVIAGFIVDADSYNHKLVSVNAGDNINCYVGNRLISPTATISKSNDSTSDEVPGASVGYKIKVIISGNDVINFKVTDLLSSGFVYRPGSYSVTKNGSPYAITEPVYHSPGVWDLGSLSVGDTIEMNYIADISSDQQHGTYKDLALASGTARYEAVTVYAVGEDSSYVNGGFVGTQVPVVRSTQNSVSAGVEKHEEGQVLGASTQLPSTGANSIWLIICTLMSLLGFSLIKKTPRKLIAILFFAAFYFFPINTFAQDNLSVRLEQPKSPTNQNDLKLVFVALEVEGTNPITVRCYKKTPSDGAYSQFGSDISLSAPGNTSQCQVDSSILNSEGTYLFYVTANGFSSNIVSTDYKTSGPGTPSDYRKDHPNSCDYKIHFKTADDSGKTVKVEIYRSDLTSFILDAGSVVTTVNVGSNEEREITNSVPDCNKTYYYVLRAFDSAGNGSGTIGDSVTVTSTSTTLGTTTTSSTTTANAIPVINITLTPEEENAQTISPTPEESTQEGSVLGTAQSTKNFLQKYWLHLILVLVIIARIIGYVLSKNKRNRR